MSRAASTRSMESGRQARVAALSRDGAQWRLVIVERNGAIRLLAERTISVGDAQQVRRALEAHSVATLLRVVPATRVVCRVAEIPGGSESDLTAAAGLMAEAELPGTVPSHRRAAGLVGGGASPEHRIVAMVAWLGEEDEGPIGGIEELWTTEPVALLSLLAPSDEGGQSPGSPRWAISADRECGSIAIACWGSVRASLRTLREDCVDAARWSEAVDVHLRRSIESVGGEVTATASGAIRRRVAIDPNSERSLPEGVRALAAEHGQGSSDSNVLLALGAALGYLRADAPMRPLFGLAAQAPASERPLWLRGAQRLASARTAMAVIGASLLVALVAPLAAAVLRHAILVSKSGGLDQQRETERQLDTQLAFYRELETRRWPMMKLTADLSCLLPVGIVAESIRIDQGQRLAMRGRAESLELVAMLQIALNASGVFAEASIDRQQMSEVRNGPGIEFDLSARVVRPFAELQGGLDFAELSLGERLYGRAASTAHVSAPESEAPSRQNSTGRQRGMTSADARGARAPREATAPQAREPAAAPQAVTDAQINAMDRATAMKEWTRRQSASRDTRFDEPTRERLKAEAEKAKARFTTLKESGS